MDKDMQSKVRVLTEELVNRIYKNPDAPSGIVVDLEISRQIALLTEEMRRISKKMDALIESTSPGV